MLEGAARQEMGLPTRTTTTNADKPSSTAAAAAAVPAGLHGSFMAASKLLREALDAHKQGGRWGECWRLLSDYPGLRPLLREAECDTITLVRNLRCCCWRRQWYAVTCFLAGVTRAAAAAAGGEV